MFYFSILKSVPLFMGAHYMNDETWKYKEADTERLIKNNNARLDGFMVYAKYGIESS